jgi:hypothetical protein
MAQPYDPATYRRLSELDDKDRQAFVRYCEELDCLHEDFTFILFDLDFSVSGRYQDNLDLKRLALVYHEDNFYFRVHAYREKLFRLINHGFALTIPDRPDRSKRDSTHGFNDRVRMSLKQEHLEGVINLIDGLWSEEAFPEARFVGGIGLLTHSQNAIPRGQQLRRRSG